jgi:hypothetical protein
LFFLLLALVAPVASGCKRGRIAEWLQGKRANPVAPSTEEMPLHAIDCPDGLARCVGGTIEVSKAARLVQPCAGGPESKQCVCPWDAVDSCARGCASEGTEIVASRERASSRLCAPDPANPVARPAVGAAAPPSACAGSDPDAPEFRCVQSLVVACGQPAVVPGVTAGPSQGQAPTPVPVIAACLRGCAEDGEILPAEGTGAENATRILCAR